MVASAAPARIRGPTWWRRPWASPALATFAAGLALLSFPGPLPAQDWPQHVAAAHVLAESLRGVDSAASLGIAGYAVALQPLPYHALWALMVPLVAALGTAAGAQATVVVLWAATVAALADAARRLARPRTCVVVALPAFFGANFAWGFAPTWAGLPAFVCCLGRAGQALAAAEANDSVARGAGARPRVGLLSLAALAGWAALAGAAHVVYLPALAVLGVSLVAARPRQRDAWAAACALAVGAVACLLPWAVQATTHHARPAQLHWESLVGAFNHLHSCLGALERGAPRATHALALAALILGAALRFGGRRPPADAAALALCGAGCLALSWAIPLAMVTDGGTSWLLGIRCLPLAELAWVLALPGLVPGNNLAARLRRSALPVAALASVGYAVAVAPTFAAFGREAGAVRVLSAALPRGATVAVEARPIVWQRAWPPLMRHLASYSVLDGAAFVEGLFVGGQLPLRLSPGSGCRAAPVDADGRLQLGRCTHVWLSLPREVLRQRAPEAAGLTLLGEAGPWRLYGPATARTPER